jgi:hypothetical protein
MMVEDGKNVCIHVASESAGFLESKLIDQGVHDIL